MQKKKVSFRHRVEYLFFTAFITVIRVSPLFLMRVNRSLALFLLKKLSKKHGRILNQNLLDAFPEQPPEETARLKQKIYYHFASIFLEIIYLFGGKNPGKFLKKIEILHPEYLEQAMQKNRGVILFSAHFGNWELVPYILSRHLNITVNSIAREMDNPLIERKVKQFREYMGSSVIYKTNSIRTILQRLQENKVVYLLIDQNVIAREAVFVDFFQRKTSAVPSVSRLHLKKNIPVIPLFLHYEKERIILEFYEELHTVPSGNMEADILTLTQTCTHIIEEKIREYPHQWFWFHDRWKTRPEECAANHSSQDKEPL